VYLIQDSDRETRTMERAVVAGVGPDIDRVAAK